MYSYNLSVSVGLFRIVSAYKLNIDVQDDNRANSFSRDLKIL